MKGLPRILRTGMVSKILHPPVPEGEEIAEIQVEGADPLYGEIRVLNAFEDADGRTIRPSLGARVSVTIEAETDQAEPRREESRAAGGR
jgi:hypothetical protein